VIAAGLALALVGAVLIDGGYALQHAHASRLPPLSLRRLLRSFVLLLRSGRWSLGFFGGLAGWALYVAALELAPLSLVQAVSAAGVAVLALGLGLSLGSHVAGSHGSAAAVVAWVAVSLVFAGAAGLLLRTGAALGAAAGVLYAAGDVATKAAVGGGARLAFVPVLLACHGLAFVCLQLAFQRGSRLATAGLAVLCTNALPILAGTLLFAETPPAGWRGVDRVVAFALVLVGAVALSREAAVPQPSPAR